MSGFNGYDPDDDYEEEYLSYSELVDRENERYTIQQHTEKAKARWKTSFRENYLSKFNHIIDDEDPEIDFYCFNLDGTTTIDYYPDTETFYLCTTKMKKVIEDHNVQTLMDLFEVQT